MTVGLDVAATPLLAFVLDRVKLRQEDSLEPSLALNINVKFRSNGNNNGVSKITLLRVNSKVFVSKSEVRGQEIGLAESWEHVILPAIGADMNVRLNLPLSPQLLSKIEIMRGGGDLHFFTYA